MAKKKSYKNVKQPTATEVLVQLLRVNGVYAVKAPGYRYLLRMRDKTKRTELMTAPELKKRFGPGTTAYEILLRHPRAHTIAKVPVCEASLA